MTSHQYTPTASKASSPAVQSRTMEELLARDVFTRVLRPGEVLDATVLSIDGGKVILDIDAKSEGIVTEGEYKEARDFIKTLRKGARVHATIVSTESQDGFVHLSLQSASQEQVWKLFERAQQNQETLAARVVGVTSVGLKVEAYGIPSFIPFTHIGKATQEKADSLLDKTIPVRVLKVEKDYKILLSERAVSEREEVEKQERILHTLAVGEKLRGVVQRIVPFGVFVQILKDEVPITGLVHNSELSWERLEDTSKVLSPGDKIDVMVLGEREGRLALSLKRLQKDPWEGVAAKFAPETSVEGRVTRLSERNVFVEVMGGIEGTILKSKLPPGAVLSVGDKVRCFVEEVNEGKRRLTLELQLTGKPIGYK